ncbi:MAG: tetratricopeptide repeat protein [Candidatus Melainabacteria bacterium]|nr:tetratricopeptide repeat protein [Candidatus Melainabacteria bacterium]
MTIALLVVAATLAGTFGTPSARAESVAADANKELEAGHFQAACQLYRLSLATHRSDVTILLNAARAYEGAGDLDEAIRRAREATVFEPNNADAHLALGHCLDINREEKAAILQFEIVLDLKKADSSTRKAAYGPLLRLLKHEAAWDKLVKTARRGAHEFPQDPDSHFNLGWALSQSPQAAPKDVPKVQREAVSEYQKSIELGERRPAVHLNLATLLADIGDSAAASESLSNYLKLAPTEASRSEVKALSAKIGGKI